VKIPKPRCLLHVGMHKTGSSSIQITLSEQPANPSYDYFKFFADGNSSHPLYSLFSEQPERYYLNQLMGWTVAEIDFFNQHNQEQLEQHLKNTQSDLVIISGEDVLLLNAAELAGLRDFLLRYCRCVEVFAYIRPFVPYIQSMLQQVLKGGAKDFVLDDLYPHYRQELEKFDTVFGRDRVRLVAFDPASFCNGDVVWDFCQQVGIVIAPGGVTRENKALSLEAAAFLYAYHKQGFEFGSGQLAIEETCGVIEALSAVGKRKIHFSKNLVQSLSEKHGADIKWAEQRLGCSLSPTASPEDTEDSISCTDDLLVLAVRYAGQLKQLVFNQTDQQQVTPQTVANWVQWLRMQWQDAQAGQMSWLRSAAQLKQVANQVDCLERSLKTLFLLLSQADAGNSARDLYTQALPLLQAGMTLPNAKQTILFNIDLFNSGRLLGWLIDSADFTKKQAIELYGSQGLLGQGIADRFRADLVGTVCEHGCCAFDIAVAATAADFGAWIVVRVVGSDQFFWFESKRVSGLDKAA